MGRKKGRQRGAFATKAQRAAYQTQIRERASEADVVRRPYLGWSSPSSSSSTQTQIPSKFQSGVRGERPRVTVSVTQLRGILAERRMQDRALDGEMRRFLSQHGTTVRSESAGRHAALARLRERGGGGGGGLAAESEGAACCGDASTPRHEAGWLLTYDHSRDFVPNDFATATAAVAAAETGEEGAERGETPTFDSSFSYDDDGEDSPEGESDLGRRQRRPRPPPSLQSLCVSALAPSLDEYVDSCGADAVRSVLDLMPSHVLADLSALYCGRGGGGVGVGDVMASVLGCHGQAERLALHSAAAEEEEDEEDDDDESSHHDSGRDRGGENEGIDFAPRGGGRRSLTDAGVLSLVPRLVPGVPYRNRRDAPDSWEELDADFSASAAHLEGCTNLRRLELCGARGVSAHALSSLLRRCSRITHLSLSESLDAESGPAALLDPADGLPSLLPDLRVLDLSRCGWLTDATLATFLLQVLAAATPPSSSSSSSSADDAPAEPTLEMVSVSGCSGVTLAAVEELNGRLGGAPYVSTVPQRRTGSCIARVEKEEREARSSAGVDRGPARGELVAVKRWRDKRSRFGGTDAAASACEDEWRGERALSMMSISAG